MKLVNNDKLGAWFTVILFLLFIAVPMVRGIVKEDAEISSSEKRALTQRPALPDSIDSLINYPEQFNDYYSDHFGYREKLNAKYFKLMNKYFPQNGFEQVTAGQEGWLFLGSSRAGFTDHGDPIGDAIHKNLYSQSQLEMFAADTQAISDWLRAQGIQYIFMVAPNKHTIYFDKLPNYLKKVAPQSAADQLYQYLRDNTDIDVVDTRSALMQAKDDAQLYFKSDTHWNYVGGNIAQFQLMKAVAHYFPDDIKPAMVPYTDFKEAEFKSGDLARFARVGEVSERYMMPKMTDKCVPTGLSPVSEESPPRRVTTCDKGQLTALIYRDSFFDVLSIYTSRQFKTVTYLSQQIDHQSLETEISLLKPDIVIQQIVERKLPFDQNADGFR